jgi:hypothetical protein
MNGNEQNGYIEYPKNYEDIANKKLEVLEKEYQSVLNSNIQHVDDEDESSEEEHKEKNEDNTNNDDMQYYQCLNNDEEFVEVEEDLVIQNNDLDGFEFVDDKSYKSPIKNPDKIKNAMKSIKLPAPKWAKEYFLLI